MRTKSKLLTALVALLIYAASGYAQDYSSCIDYNRIRNGSSECRFDLKIGDLTFTDAGVIRPENTLTDKDIDDAIRKGMYEYLKTFPGNANVPENFQMSANICGVVQPLNNAVKAMEKAFGPKGYNEYKSAYNSMNNKFTRFFASLGMPDAVEYFVLLVDMGGSMSQLNPGGGKVSDFPDPLIAFFEYWQAYAKRENITAEQMEIIKKGTEAQRELSNIYDKIYEQVKEKMGDMSWVMKIDFSQRQTVERVFWNIKVNVDYVIETMNLKKVVNSGNYEGMYTGDIVIRIENMQGLDEVISQLTEVTNIVNPIDELYKRLPYREFANYSITVNNPTEYVRRIRFENVIVDVKEDKKWQYMNLSDRNDEKPIFSFDCQLNAAAKISWRTANFAEVSGFWKDNMTLKSTDPAFVDAIQKDSDYRWFVVSSYGSRRGKGEGMTGQGGYTYKVDMPENNFLKVLDGGGKIVMRP